MTDFWQPFRRRFWLRHAMLAAAALGAALLALLSYETGALSGLERQSIDARFAIRGTQPPGNSIVIVAVDQRAIRAIHVRAPIPRGYYARLLDALHAARPRLLAIDAQFIGKTDIADDTALLAAVARDGPVLLATNDTDQGPAPVPADVRNASGAVLASAAVDPDPDGVLRRMMEVQIKTPTLAVRAAEVLGHPVTASDFPGNHAWVDFRGPPGTFTTYSMIDVLDGRVPSQAFAGRVVLVGVTDPVQKDVFITAVSSLPMSGVEFHANALTTILNGFPLQSAGALVDIALLFVLAAFPVLLSLRFAVPRDLASLLAAGPPSLIPLLASIAALPVFLIAAQLAFDSGVIISVPNPILALALGVVGAVAADAFTQRRQLQNLRTIFPVAEFFISYRHEQSETAAGALREALVRKCGEGSVFMDTEAIDPGQRWSRRLEEAIAECRAMLVVIGPQWLEGSDGSRRLDDPDDWVRREIEAGLARPAMVVVPVLHDGAKEPKEDALPDAIKALAHCQAVRWTGRQAAVDELIDRIQRGWLRDAQRPQQSVTAS
jgi:CHASE2 domain-containing sensor protein